MSASQTRLRIAILGTRGIPARYGGFETFAEQLSVRLVQRGFDVTVSVESAEGRSRTFRNAAAKAESGIFQDVTLLPMASPSSSAAL